MTLNCIIVDENPKQLLATLKLIKEHPSLNLIGEYSSTIESKKFLLNTVVDLIIMDVNSPVLNGFDLLDIYETQTTSRLPFVIIISDDKSLAFKAFQHNVMDFICKSVTKKRFNEAISKAILQYKMVQNFYDYEFIIVDDINDISISKYLLSLAQKFSKIKVIKNNLKKG